MREADLSDFIQYYHLKNRRQREKSDVLAQEIVGNLEAALMQFKSIVKELEDE